MRPRSVLLPLLLPVLTGSAFAAPRGVASPGALTLGAGFGTRVFDQVVSVTSIFPELRRTRELTASLEMSYQLTSTLRASAQGRLGGSFYDLNFSTESAENSEQSWGTRLGVDWYPLIQEKSALYIGFGYDYGEGRSFSTSTLGFVDVDGPINYFSGASGRTGISASVTERTRLRAEIVFGGYYGHAEAYGARHRWLGSSLGGSIGLDFDILSGRAD